MDNRYQDIDKRMEKFAEKLQELEQQARAKSEQFDITMQQR
ncbi:MAG: hypothetical protein QF872_06265 [Gammaproteobacteria bacterium]|nr:hypothetical protein [Gammaproteobacteria bacterium]